MFGLMVLVGSPGIVLVLPGLDNFLIHNEVW